MNADMRQAIGGVMDAFRSLGVPFAIGGSIASSAWGIARSTLDADFVAEIRAERDAASGA